MANQSTCYVRANDFAQHFADVEPMTLCPDCQAVWISTGHDRCDACQCRKDEAQLHAADPRRG